MARRRSSYGPMANINITSLVDVTLCLLIIFMLTAPYIPGGVEVNLPEADTRNVVVKEKTRSVRQRIRTREAEKYPTCFGIGKCN